MYTLSTTRLQNIRYKYFNLILLLLISLMKFIYQVLIVDRESYIYQLKCLYI